MNFHLHRTNRSRKVYKQWWDDSRQYRITWTREVEGIRVQPHYYALVRVRVPRGECWDFVAERRPYRTFSATQKACEAHQRRWLLATRATTRTELRQLGVTLFTTPVWVIKQSPLISSELERSVPCVDRSHSPS